MSRERPYRLRCVSLRKAREYRKLLREALEAIAKDPSFWSEREQRVN